MVQPEDQDAQPLMNTLTSDLPSEIKTPRNTRRSKKSSSSEVTQELEPPAAKTPTNPKKPIGDANLSSSVVSSPVVKTPGRGRRRTQSTEPSEVQAQPEERTLEAAEKSGSTEITPLPATPSRSLRSQTIQIPKLETISETGNVETPGRRSKRSAASKTVDESVLTPSRRTRSTQSATAIEEVTVKPGKTPRSRSTSSAPKTPEKTLIIEQGLPEVGEIDPSR
jgi:hypothetical protein